MSKLKKLSQTSRDTIEKDMKSADYCMTLSTIKRNYWFSKRRAGQLDAQLNNILELSDHYQQAKVDPKVWQKLDDEIFLLKAKVAATMGLDREMRLRAIMGDGFNGDIS